MDVHTYPVFLRPRFRGARFESERISLDILTELAAYRDLVACVAEEVYRVRHPREPHAPRGFAASCQFVVAWSIEEGHARVRVHREPPHSQTQAPLDDCLAEARQVIQRLVADPDDLSAQKWFPYEAYAYFHRFGRTLTVGDSIELHPPSGRGPTYTRSTRSQLLHIRSRYGEERKEDAALLLERRMSRFRRRSKSAGPLSALLQEALQQARLGAWSRREGSARREGSRREGSARREGSRREGSARREGSRCEGSARREGSRREGSAGRAGSRGERSRP